MSQTLTDLVLAAAKHNNAAADSAQIATRSAKYVEQIVNDATNKILEQIEANVRALVEPVVQSLLTEIEEDVATKQDKLVADDTITIAEDGKTIGVTPDTFVKLGAMNDMRGDINESVRLINRANGGETHPIFRLGSQVSNGDIRTDRWVSDIFYNSIRFTAAPGVHTRLSFQRNGVDSIVRKEEMDTELSTKQDTLIAGENITIAADGKTISATGGGGGSVECDETLSNTSTNPIQNQWLGKRMGATSANSVQIGYDAKAGKTSGQAVDGAGGDNGFQVAVGREANGSVYGTAVGNGANGSIYGAAVGNGANGSNNGVAVGRSASGYNSGVAVGYCTSTGSVSGAVAVGNNAKANPNTPIVIGGSQFASTAQITVTSAGVLKVGGKEIGGGNTEVWNDTIDSIDGVTDDMIGAKPLSNGNYPRLHARNKEIHGCTGFSNETGSYTGQEFLLDWSVAKTNGSSFLSSHTIWNSDRGFGADVTFAQPLMPAATGAYKPSPYAIPCFENSPVYWSGHFMYNDVIDADGVYRMPIKQVRIPWDTIASGATESIAFVSQLAALEQRIAALENA